MLSALARRSAPASRLSLLLERRFIRFPYPLPGSSLTKCQQEHTRQLYYNQAVIFYPSIQIVSVIYVCIETVKLEDYLDSYIIPAYNILQFVNRRFSRNFKPVIKVEWTNSSALALRLLCASSAPDLRLLRACTPTTESQDRSAQNARCIAFEQWSVGYYGADGHVITLLSFQFADGEI